jgi:hypothetical protein
MLMSGPVSWATIVSEYGSPLFGVGSAVMFFILAADADVWACHKFFERNLLPGFIRAHKTTPKKIIKIRTICIWTFSI